MGPELPRGAVERSTSRVEALGNLLRVRLDVGHDHQVEVAIAVEVAETSGGRPAV